MSSAPHARPRAAAVRWTSRDTQPAVTYLSLAGIAAAALLAALGMPPISIHGPLHFLGIMDPLCGMTRGVAAATRGDLVEAVRFNPASPMVVLSGAFGIVRGVVGLARGQWLELRLRATRGIVLAAAVLVFALAVRQQLNAPLLGG